MNEANLQGELDGAVLALQERAALLDALNAKLTSVGDTLDAFEHELQARPSSDAPRLPACCLNLRSSPCADADVELTTDLTLHVHPQHS